MSRLDRDIIRDIQKKVKGSKKSAEKWYEEHEAELQKRMEENSEIDDSFGTIKAKRRFTNVLWLVGTGIILVGIVVTTAVLLINNNRSQTQPQIPDLTFGEEDVAVSVMSDEEIFALVAQVPQFTKFNIARGDKTTYRGDGSLVMHTIRGEYETPDDFYLIEARVLYNDNFAFLSRPEYDYLEETRQFGDITVNYQLIMKNSDDIYIYYAVSESGAGTVYWRIESYEGLFDEWLEDTFA